MEDAEGGLSFDFEGGLETGAATVNPPSLGPSIISNDPTLPTTSVLEPVNNTAGQKPPTQSNRRSFRQTVCRHWLRSLCMKGDACGFLHQFDKARMPVCRFFARFGECREQDCVYKHTNDDAKECNMYKLGFCPNGPDCRYRHQKMPGPPPPVEEVFQQTQQWASTANGAYANRHSQRRHNNYHHQVERSQWQQPSAGASQRPPGSSSLVEDSQNQQQTHHLLQQQPNQNQTQSLNPLSNGLSSQPNTVSAASPLPQGHSRYFIVKSNNRENLELSVQQGMWATQRNNEGKLNEAFDSCENIILIFSVNRTRHFQGCAKMTSKIGGFVGGGGWKYAHGTAHYGRNFCLKWLKLCELSFYKTRHLRNPYNENLPVKISRDCQELEPSIGEQLASLLYLEPDSELMAIAWAVESKREDEKAQGVNSTPENEDPNIVPFEDNDDDQDEDESDEEESSSQTLSANQGRGRGRGIMWPPHGPMARGGRGMAGSKPMGFHPVMVGGDGYGFDMLGMGPAEGFAMPDMFSTPAGPSQGFPTYGHQGPRFASPEFSNLAPPSGITFSPMDGSVSAPGMVFHGRPPTHNGMFPHGGPRMMVPGSTHAPILGGSGGPSGMMGAVRPHFMGGPGAVGRPIRLTAMPYRPPQGGNSVKGRRDQKRRRNERNNSGDRLSLGMDQRASGKSRQMQSSGEGLDADSKVKFHGPAGPQHQDGFENHKYAANHDDDSESEDEAPRRSRHGESKKKRRDWDGEEGNRADHWELPLPLTGVNPEDGAH